MLIKLYGTKNRYQDSPVVNHKEEAACMPSQHDYQSVIYSYQHCEISKCCSSIVLGTAA